MCFQYNMWKPSLLPGARLTKPSKGLVSKGHRTESLPFPLALSRWGQHCCESLDNTNRKTAMRRVTGVCSRHSAQSSSGQSFQWSSYWWSSLLKLDGNIRLFVVSLIQLEPQGHCCVCVSQWPRLHAPRNVTVLWLRRQWKSEKETKLMTCSFNHRLHILSFSMIALWSQKKNETMKLFNKTKNRWWMIFTHPKTFNLFNLNSALICCF